MPAASPGNTVRWLQVSGSGLRCLVLEAAATRTAGWCRCCVRRAWVQRGRSVERRIKEARVANTQVPLTLFSLTRRGAREMPHGSAYSVTCHEW